MKAISFLTVAVLGLTLLGCDSKKSSTQGGNPILAPVDYLDANAKAKINSEKKIDTIAINQAVQMFSTEEGRYPTDLKELVVKGYMRAIPEPPYGMTIVYDATLGEVKVVKK